MGFIDRSTSSYGCRDLRERNPNYPGLTRRELVRVRGENVEMNSE